MTYIIHFLTQSKIYRFTTFRFTTRVDNIPNKARFNANLCV